MRRFMLTTALTLFAVTMLLSAYASTVQVFQIASGNSDYAYLTLAVGQYVSGSFSVTGDAYDQQIIFWVANPHGTLIIDYGTVSGGAEFDFTADEEGTYTLQFFNSPGLSYIEKTVTLTYDVTTPISSADYVLISVVVAVVLGLLVVFIFIAYDRRRSRPPIREVRRRPMVRMVHASCPATCFF